MKKLLLSLGAVAAVAAPVAAVVACGSTNDSTSDVTAKHFDTLAEFTAGNLVVGSAPSGEYSRNQFLFKTGSESLKTLLATVTPATENAAVTLSDLDNAGNSLLDALAEKLRNAVKSSTNDEFKALANAENHPTPAGTSSIVLGLFTSKGATADDSVLLGINGVKLSVAKDFVKYVAGLSANSSDKLLQAIAKAI